MNSAGLLPITSDLQKFEKLPAHMVAEMQFPSVLVALCARVAFRIFTLGIEQSIIRVSTIAVVII